MWYDEVMKRELDEDDIRLLLENAVDDVGLEIDYILDDVYEPFKIKEMVFYPSTIIKKLDPILYSEIYQEERDGWIHNQMYQVERYSAVENETLYDFLNLEKPFEPILESVIWKDEEDEDGIDFN